MEVVLLLLDDLDDLVFVVASLWERTRRLALSIGLFASMCLAATELSFAAPQWSSILAGVAAASVMLWMLAALIALPRRFGRRSAVARA